LPTSATIRASITIGAPADAIFAVLSDPAQHARIDGTGWVCDPLDRQLLTASGQIFRMGMYHPGHPNRNYQMANRVRAFDPPYVISWEPGYDRGDGTLRFEGWIWRYDLVSLVPSETEVTLTYDWSAVPEPERLEVTFPPFPPDHLDNSLAHLAELVVA
jgi:uncharacterized protein YndB with AHSA1/START domain